MDGNLITRLCIQLQPATPAFVHVLYRFLCVACVAVVNPRASDKAKKTRHHWESHDVLALAHGNLRG